MVHIRHAAQRGARLALPTGGDDQHLTARQAHRGLEADRGREVLKIAIVLRHLDNPVERTAGDTELPPRHNRDFAEGLQAGDIAGEGGHDHPLALVARDFFHQRTMDGAFRARGVRIEHIGRIAHQCEHAFIADFAQFFLGGRFADDRIVIKLPVARVENAAMRRVDQQRVALGNRVRQREVGDGEWAKLNFTVIFFDDDDLDLAEQPGLFQLARDQIGGERRRIKRHAQLAREIGNRADVILVRVRKDDADQVLAALLDEIEIGEDQLDTGIFIARKGHAEIDHDPLALAAVEIDVHANLPGTAKGEKQEFVFGGKIFLQCVSGSVREDQAASACLASMARPSSVRSASTWSKISVASSNNMASPPVATTFAGRPISAFILATMPSIIAT